MTLALIYVGDEVAGNRCGLCRRSANFKISGQYFCRMCVAVGIDEALMRREQYVNGLNASAQSETKEPSQ